MPTRPDKMIQYSMSVAEEFQSRLRRMQAFVQHPLTSGIANEDILREFLARHAPGDFCVGQGFICDPSTDEPASKQCDILIYNQNRFPIVYANEPIKIVWPKSVRMVIEVKTNFKPRDISMALENIESAKKLYSHLSGLIFAYESPSISTVVKNLEAYPRHINREHLPNAILILDKDIIIHRWGWRRAEQKDTNPGINDDSYAVVKGTKGKPIVITFMLLHLLEVLGREVGLYSTDAINISLELFRTYSEEAHADITIGAPC
jgi:hypothetical protein